VIEQISFLDCVLAQKKYGPLVNSHIHKKLSSLANFFSVSVQANWATAPGPNKLSQSRPSYLEVEPAFSSTKLFFWNLPKLIARKRQKKVDGTILTFCLNGLVTFGQTSIAMFAVLSGSKR